MLRPLFLGIFVLLVSGCASYGVVENTPATDTTGEQNYSIKSFMQEWRTSDDALLLAFSGGGTRAAALSYGVGPVDLGHIDLDCSGFDPDEVAGITRHLEK